MNETRCKNRGKKAKEQNALMRCILKRGEKRSASTVLKKMKPGSKNEGKSLIRKEYEKGAKE